MTTEQNAPDILTFEPNYIRASAGKRFLNYFIDILVFYALFFAIGIVIALLFPASLDSLGDNDPGFGLIDRIITLVIYAVYMGLVEAIFKGKSIGKLITQTRALNLDGTRISVKTAFARGFSRAVPFCVFSALGTPCDPWQDRWTNTMVVDEKQIHTV